ncbi:MAG: DUF1877 family protein [Kofleriaceae bacterium]
MASKCNLFAIDDTELEVGPEPETSLPGYDEQTSVMTQLRRLHTLQLGTAWPALHAALGNHDADCVLGFLAAGGTVFGWLEDGPRSSGRYFSPEQVRTLHGALDRIADDAVAPELQKLYGRIRSFVAEAEQTGRGIVVHHMR